MWARIVEAMLGMWLLLSPFIFGSFPVDRALYLNDFICGGLMFCIALLAIWPPAQYARLVTLIIALWLIGFGYFHGGYPASPGHQNEILVGLIAVLFPIIPLDANNPPADWQRYYQRKAQEAGARLP